MVWNAKLRLDLQGDASPPNRLTGELNIRYIPIWDGQQTGGYVEQTNSITLSR
jgi:hypothetical protein